MVHIKSQRKSPHKGSGVCICVCVCACATASSDCPHRTVKALILAREACTQFKTKENQTDKGGGMGETHSR